MRGRKSIARLFGVCSCDLCPDRVLLFFANQVASKAGYLLSCLLVEHPMMKPIVFREVRRFVFRPNLSDRAKYYSIIFLNQMVLSEKEAEGGSALAKDLIDCYFALFTVRRISGKR